LKVAASLGTIGTFAGAFTFGTLLSIFSDFDPPSVLPLLAFAFVSYFSALLATLFVTFQLRNKDSAEDLDGCSKSCVQAALFAAGVGLLIGTIILHVVLIIIGNFQRHNKAKEAGKALLASGVVGIIVICVFVVCFACSEWITILERREVQSEGTAKTRG
jgi:integral membrane sensor domain MASE1